MVLLLEFELLYTEVYMFKVYCLYNKKMKKSLCSVMAGLFCDFSQAGTNEVLLTRKWSYV